ncbi:MAG: hypothetical protein M0D57_04630 [Sphingobacteriales bacterium JAD_PAG50586_3]|nr:MAG: hypothetical protein M0D57_04630 [Sphingobacteriales bacterium JAD_PAG50586_3]
MEETLYDSKGNAVAYIAYNDSATIYLWNGTPVAYLEGDKTIYGYNGKHLGWYEDGIVRNLRGEKAGFNKAALPVFAKFEPFKSFKKFKPFKAFKQFAKFKPFYSFGSSNEPLSQYLMAGR